MHILSGTARDSEREQNKREREDYRDPENTAVKDSLHSGRHIQGKEKDP